jgi:2-phosphosulfolactate phosphatase
VPARGRARRRDHRRLRRPTPLALLRLGLAGRALVYATTNGTVALRRAAAAAAVYAGAIANGEALAGHLARRHLGETVLLACAGSAGRFNLEDFCGAGYLASLLLGAPGAAWEPSDAALGARELYQRGDAPALLAAGRVGRMMRHRGLDAEVAYAARPSHLAVVPQLRHGAVRASSPAP